jgi:hypothetical protein
MRFLLDPLALELPSGHELFTLSCYVKAATGKPNHELVTDLLNFVYQAQGRKCPSQKALEGQLQRFTDKPHSVVPVYAQEV